MKKGIIYVVLAIGIIFFINYCKSNKLTEAEKSAKHVTELKTIFIPDTLRTLHEIETLTQYQDYMKTVSEEYLDFCKEFRKPSSQQGKRYLLAKELMVKRNGICLSYMLMILMDFRIFNSKEIDRNYIYSVLGKDAARSLAEKGEIVKALNVSGNELDDLLYPERYQKYFELYAYFFERSNKRIEKAIGDNSK